MATVAQLRARAHATIGYLLAIEGLPHMWTTIDDITGSGGGSWIGTSLGHRVVVGGLHIPESVTFAVKDGMPESPGATFGLTDFDGTVAGYFGDAEPDAIDYTEERLVASSSAAPTTLTGYGDTINLHDANIGIEAIGPSGERRHFKCFPNDSLPGLHHAAASDEYSGSLNPIGITGDPWLMEGRRVTLWRLYRDDDGSWPSWTDQAAAGPPIFWGVLRVLGKVEGRTWWVKCDGPEAFLRKLLNQNAPSEWILATPAFTLSTADGEREDLMACSFQKVTSTGTVTENGVELFSTGDAITSTTDDSVRLEVRTFLLATAALGVNKYTGNSPEGLANYPTVADGICLQIENDASGKAGVCRLVLHEKVWRLLGWDPRYQARPDTNLRTLQDVEFVELEAGALYTANSTSASVPGHGYWEATFRTRKLGAPAYGASASEQTNDEKWRFYHPVTPTGTLVVDHLGGQELGIGVDGVYLEPQLGRPPAAVQIDSTDVEGSRWWLMRGPYRGGADDEVRERLQVFKGSWVDVESGGDDTGVVAEGSFGQRSVYIERFENPRMFGIDDDKLDRPWAVPDQSQALSVKPLAVLRYSPEGVPDYAHHVLLRLLLSTGTASVSGNEDADDPPTLTAGDNDHSDATGKHAFATDAELADLGLAIPQSLVNWKSFLSTANQLPGGWAGPLNRCVVAWSGVAQAGEIIEQVMEGRGWSLGLAGGKFTLFPRYGAIDASQAEANLGASSWHGEPSRPGHVPAVSIRSIEPVDRWVLKSGRHPDSGEYQGEYEIRARDDGSSYRMGRRMVEVKAWGLTPDLWQAAPQNRLDAVALFGSVASTWRAQPHQRVTCKVQRTVGETLYPGAIVTISNDWLPDLDGGYGLTGQPARVMQARHFLDGGQVELELQVEGKPGGQRRWAPVARLLDDVTNVEDRYDDTTYTWKCYQDAFGHSDPGITSDVEWFAEPAWSSLGGGMLVHVWQYGGGEDGWAQTASFTVSTVDTANHTITATGAYTGTWYRRKYTLLVPAPYASQTAAWVKALFLVTTKANGKFGAGPTRGWKLGV